MRSVQAILEDAGYETDAYSGRGMGGKECLSVSMDGHIGKLFSDVLGAIEPEDTEAMAKAFRGMQQDSMGKGSVVYFPRIPFEAKP